MGLLQRLYTWLGFKKAYNGRLFCIFALPFFAFALSQFVQCYTIKGIRISQTAPGEMYWFQSGHRRLGLQIHLAAILPCALLAVLQFIPSIRQKTPTFHRINGHIVLVLLLIAHAGALMIGRHAFGGSVDVLINLAIIVAMTTIGGALAYYNIRRLQIDQHRAWMLRTMFYLGVIVSARPVILIAAFFVSVMREYRNVWPCEMIDWTWKSYGGDGYLESYPQCVNQSGASAGFSPVLANILSKSDPAEIGTSLQIPAGIAFWTCLLLHVVGVEIYLALTPREAARLRMESYKRQLAAGYKNPGSEGLVPEKFGDADPWVHLGRFDCLENVAESDGFLGNGERVDQSHYQD